MAQTRKTQVLSTSVRKLLRHQAYDRVANLLLRLHPVDIAKVLAELAERDQIAAYRVLVQKEREKAADVLKELGVDRASEILLKFPVTEASRVLQELETDDAALVISALPKDVAETLLEEMRVEESAEVQGLLEYESETAGRIMTPNVFALHEDLTVNEAIHTIQTTKDFEMVFYLFVVDDRGHLVGVASLRQLLMVSPDTPLKSVMMTDVISVSTDTDQEEVARQVALYDLLAVPVVDSENKLVGMITVDDVIDVIKDEATEDIFYLAGVEADDHIYTPPSKSFSKRFPWLIVNLGTALFASIVVSLYELTIEQFAFLAVFLPIVAGMGGNAGTQTLTVIIRGLALGEVSWDNTRHAFFKELMVGIANGIALGVLAGIVAFLWKGLPLLGVVLGIAMLVNMTVAGLTGTLIPLVLKQIGIDPAIASGILVTTFTDLVGFFAFLGLFSLLLNYFPVS